MTKSVLPFVWMMSSLVAQQAGPALPANAAEARKLLAAMPVHEAVADGAVVRVIDGMKQQAVAGADVYVIEMPETPERLRHLEALARSETDMTFLVAAVSSTRYRTGDDGAVRVARPTRGAFLVIAGDRLGTGRAGQETPIEVYAEHAVDVVVRTAEGKPVRGVPVGVGRGSGHPQTGPEPVRTDREGKAHLPIDRMLGLDVFVGVVGAFTTPCEQKVDLRKPTQEPVVLTVPACGQVRFILYGPDEKPATGLGFASLRLVGTPDPQSFRERQRWTTAQPSEYAPDNVTFGCVEIGHDVSVTVEVAGMAKSLEFRGKGPVRAGELVIVDGRLTVGPPILSFRVVDQQGQPVAKERIGFVVRGENRYRISDSETDADGRIALPLEKTDGADLWVIRRSMSAGTDYRGAVHRALGGVVPGPQDLGDLRLVDEPVAARGRLVDVDGKPVAGVWLKGETSLRTGSGGGSWTSQYWFFEHRVQTGTDGTFALRELDPLDGALQLATEGGDWVSPGGIELRLGQQGVQDFTLWQPSTITARFAGQDVMGIGVDATLVHRETGKALRTQFRDGQLPPVHWAAGTYDLKIGPSELGFTIENIRAPAGGKAGDERLRAIALPAELLIVRATVVDEDEKPVSDLVVWCNLMRPGGGSHGTGVQTDKDGRAVFLARKKDCEIAIQSVGFEDQKVNEFGPEPTLHVVRVASRKAKFEGLPELLPQVFLNVSCTQDAGQRVWGNQLRGGETTLQFRKRGTWHVRLLPTLNSTGITDTAVQRQIMQVLSGADIAFEVEATGKPTEPKTFTLTKEQHDDLVERLRTVKEILAEQKDK